MMLMLMLMLAITYAQPQPKYQKLISENKSKDDHF